MRLLKKLKNIAVSPLSVPLSSAKMLTGGGSKGGSEMGAANSQKSDIDAETSRKQSELASRRKKLALGMAKARKNRGGYGFASSPAEKTSSATLG